MSEPKSTLRFITCASNPGVLADCLLRSPDMESGHYPLAVHLGATSAAAAFNAEMEHPLSADWLVWVHQDVYLPEGWARSFRFALDEAATRFPRLGIAGVYGIAGSAEAMRRAGHVIDRGNTLYGEESLPFQVDSLDELLLAVRADTDLRFDPNLGFDFYGTDIVLQARDLGLQAIVVDACCEHRSSTPLGKIDAGLKQRIDASGKHFEQKWRQALPLTTPCLNIHRPGDVARWTARLCE